MVIGLSLAYAWSNDRWDDAHYANLTLGHFERGLLIPANRFGHVDDITVLPTTSGQYEVTCTQVRQAMRTGRLMEQPCIVKTSVPFKSSRTGKTYPNVIAFLRSLQSKDANVHIAYAWYRQGWAYYALWVGASLLVIGGVWPSVVSLLTGGGLGLARVPRGPDYDLDRFGQGEPPEEPKGATTSVGEQDLQEVRRLDEELEKQLAGGTHPAAAPATEPVQASGQAVRELDAGPLEATEIPKEELEKEYGGEFYPVVRSVHKKSDEPPHE